MFYAENTAQKNEQYLNHFLEELVNLVLPAAEVTTLNEVVDLLPPSTGGCVQLEGPQEVGCILEVGSNIQDLVPNALQ